MKKAKHGSVTASTSILYIISKLLKLITLIFGSYVYRSSEIQPPSLTMYPYLIRFHDCFHPLLFRPLCIRHFRVRIRVKYGNCVRGGKVVLFLSKSMLAYRERERRKGSSALRTYLNFCIMYVPYGFSQGRRIRFHKWIEYLTKNRGTQKLKGRVWE